MTEQNKDLDILLDDTLEQLAATEPAAEHADAAAARVWQRLSTLDGVAADAAELQSIDGCDDYQSLLPAYLAGSLPQARRLLLEDHSRECVPCRRALKAAREGRTLEKAQPIDLQPTRRRHSFARWAIAAALVAGIGVTQYVIRETMPFGNSQSATVHSTDGELFRVAANVHHPMSTDDTLLEGQTIRTGRDGGAVLRLEDGSLVELSTRSEVSIEESRRGTTIQLERGNVIVQAAQQRDRHLYVATDDCLVSVTGTIFSVNHGTKGSRVSVIEGEVKVNFDDSEEVLTPGEQVATETSLGSFPLDREIAWSRDIDKYLEMLEGVDALRRDLRAAVTLPELRYDSQLLDLVADDTVFYAALPNFSDTVSQTHQVVEEHLANNPALAEWWNSDAGHELEPVISDLVDRIAEFGAYLGDEMVVSSSAPMNDNFESPLVMAEVSDAGALRDFIERQIAEAGDESGHPIDDEIIWVEDPRQAPQGGEDKVLVWLDDALLVATLDASDLAQVADIYLDGENNPFVGSEFYEEIANLYSDGADILVAVDLGQVVEQVASHDAEHGDDAAKTGQAFSLLGVDQARHLLVEQKRLESKTHYSMAMSFDGERTGVASWLAAPAPMGSLDFVSPEAKLVFAVVFEDPADMFDDMSDMTQGNSGLSEFVNLFRQEHGIDLRNDLFGALGGELTVALDGPLLPTPAWKIILEVYDPARLQFAIEQAVAEGNQRLAEAGELQIAINREGSGGRTIYSVGSSAFTAHYTFIDGYLVAAPDRALLDRATRYHGSGYSLVDSSDFRSLLPQDGRNNFSAVVYQDLSSLLQSVAERLGEGNLNPEQQKALDALKSARQPTLGIAYGDADRITLAASSEGDVLSSVLMRALGVKDPGSWDQLLQDTLGGATDF